MVVLLCAVSLEKVVVRKCLETGSLPYRQAAALTWIGMDEVVPVFGDMTGYGRTWGIESLNPESVDEFSRFPICMIRGESLQREIQMALGCPVVYLTEHGCVEVTR